MMKRNIDNDAIGTGGKRNCLDIVSRVLHIRNVSSDVTERDITNLAIPFGPITYLVLTRKTGQALMEMQHEESARAMIEYYNECPPILYSKSIGMQYSRYETLSGTGMHHDAEVAVKAVNEDIKRLCQEEPRLVLHVTVESWDGPRLGHLHFFKLLHRFGNILRIIVFFQNQSPQALVEFENEISANVAKLQLGVCGNLYGRPIHIEFSNRKSLDIKHESDTGRDYTISPVLKEELNNIQNFNQSTIHSNDYNERFHDYPMMRSNSMAYTAAEALEILQPLLRAANNNPNGALPILQNLAPTLSSLLAQGQGISNGRSFDNGRVTVNTQSEKSFNSPVLMVTNLNEDRVTPDALFVLFGCYGDVMRVKIMYNKKSSALVQFVDSENAERAINNLNGVSMFGRQMKISYSKHANISMPKTEEQQSAHLNKEYSNSRLHRFKRTTSRTIQNIHPPGLVLHIAGLPDSFSEDDIKRIMEEEHFRVVKIKIISPQQRKMALAQLDTIDLAVEALIRLHDLEVANASRLRVSFSKGFITS